MRRALMPIVAALLVLVVGYLTWEYHAQSAVLDAQAKQIAQLVADRQTGRVPSLDAQERCSKQALATFKEFGWEKNPSAAYGNHFNVNLGRCFMEIESMTTTGSTPWTNKVLLDAFEGRVIGSYAWRADPVKKYWEVPPVQCEVDSPAGEKETCKSDDEFGRLVRVYME
jgi:hypothetical protein